MRRTVHAEWTKLRTVPSTAWLVLAAVGATVVVAAVAVSSVDVEHCPPAGCVQDIPKLSLTGVWLAQAAVAVLAVLAVTNEYGTGMIHTTLAAIPRRGLVLAGKAVAVTAAVLPAAALGVLGALAAGRAIPPGNGYAPANGYPLLSLADEATRRAAAGTALYLGLVALLGLGLGMIIRDTAGAITAVLTLLYVSPVIAGLITDPDWREWLQRVSPTAGLSVQATEGLDALPIGPWAGLGVLAGYAGGALLLGLVAVRLRDA